MTEIKKISPKLRALVELALADLLVSPSRPSVVLPDPFDHFEVWRQSHLDLTAVKEEQLVDNYQVGAEQFVLFWNKPEEP